MKRKAFTLVEIMAASAIMAIIVLGVLSVASNILKTYSRASGQLQNFFDANVIGNIIVADLESINYKRDGNAWLEVKYPRDVGILRGRTFTDKAPLRPPEIMFYASTALRPLYTKENTSFNIGGDNTTRHTMIPGSLCAIKYQIALKSPFMASQGHANDARQYNAFYGFYRAVIDSRSTILENMGGDKQGYTANPEVQTYRNALSMNVWGGTSSIVDEKGEEVSGVNLDVWSRSPENLLATNVVDFRITFAVMYKNLSASTPDDPKYRIAYIPPGADFTVGPRILAEQAYEISNSGGRMSVDPGSEEFKNGMLSFADVSITVLSDSGAREMLALMRSNRLTDDDFLRIVAQHGNTVVRRVRFMAEPLE